MNFTATLFTSSLLMMSLIKIKVSGGTLRQAAACPPIEKLGALKGKWLALIILDSALVILDNALIIIDNALIALIVINKCKKNLISQKMVLISPFLPWFDSLKKLVKSYMTNSH